MILPGRSRRSDVAAGAYPLLSSWDVYASEFPGLRSFLDVSSARCRPRAQCGWRPNRSIELHLYVQPRRNPEQPDAPAVSLSDTARRRLYRPCDFCLRSEPTTFNVGGVDYTLSMSFLDSNGNPVAEFITREGGLINTASLVGQFTLPPTATAPVLRSRSRARRR